MTPEYPSGPFDQRAIEARPDVRLFTTPPLERATEVTGPVRVRLWAASSAPDTDFVARLVDLYPDGRSINLTDGIVRARYRDFPAGAPLSLIEPGRPYAYEVDLWATSTDPECAPEGRGSSPSPPARPRGRRSSTPTHWAR